MTQQEEPTGDKEMLIRIDAHVTQLGRQMERHDVRLAQAERDIIEERGVRQGMERAMQAEHKRIHDKIDALGNTLRDMMASMNKSVSDRMEAINSLLHDHTKQEELDRREILKVLWTVFWTVIVGVAGFAATVLHNRLFPEG